MSLWFAGYPKTPGCDVRFGSKCDLAGLLTDVRQGAGTGPMLAGSVRRKGAMSRSYQDRLADNVWLSNITPTTGTEMAGPVN